MLTAAAWKRVLQPIYSDYAYFEGKKITLKSSAQKLELKLSLVHPFQIMCDTPPSIQDGCHYYWQKFDMRRRKE